MKSILQLPSSILVLFASLFLGASEVNAYAMDRYAALSQIESGDRDNVIGPDGEVSRYQISPAVWSRTVRAWHLPVTLHPQNVFDARRVAGCIMLDRTLQFRTKNHRQPGDYEWYLLWHRPARLLRQHAARITSAEADRAGRFVNLCKKTD